MEQSNVSNKSYQQLLDMSDTESSSSTHVPPLILTSPRKKRYRKFGSRDKFTEKVTFEKCPLRTLCVFFILSVLIIWLLTMSWFINALQNELDKFNHTIVTIAAGNRGVPDDLQKCHAISKQLQQNQTVINQRLTVYDGQITNLTLQITLLGTRLSMVEKNIKEKTGILLTSDASKELSPQVAQLGSNYQDLSTSVKSLKDTVSSLLSYQTTLKANITSIEKSLNNAGIVKTDETKINNVSEKLHRLIDDIKSNITSMNQTLTSKIDWLSSDQKNDRVDIEKLKEDRQQLIAQVKTIESECKSTEIKFTKSFKEVDSKMISLKTHIDMIATNVTNLHAQSISNDSYTSAGQLKGEKNGTQ
ncbi:uncharacterized protein LOC112689458 isoform X2 [Sipha flava]|uniref:Uncharacterized protein LOC112689458 isoform X2 n=1 Tax=Sipha flava TaxID=143950 RepID=A0A8B8G7W6_9HEMI|nr:uncharacterized protein LOC112689458 isoform X2 [Sipha flava]